MEKGEDMEVINLKLTEVRPYENNPRHNEDAVGLVAESIRRFGFNVPILLDADKVIVAGHTRYEAAKVLGLEEVPCIIMEDMSEEAARQFRIVDNKTGELSSWDYEKLIAELDNIKGIDMSIFDFGKFDKAAEPANLESNLDEGKELDLTEFEDEIFDFECPYCGFRWNE